MTERYKYDLSDAYGAMGRANINSLEERRKDKITPDPPRPAIVSTNRSIMRQVGKQTQNYIREELSANLNQGFCIQCRKLLQGTGRPAMTVVADDSTDHYCGHWDGYHIEKSAKLGCHLCLSVYRVLRYARAMHYEGEEIPISYDFGKFLFTGTDGLALESEGPTQDFAVLFYNYAIMEKGGRMMPKQLPHITVTLHPTSNAPSFVAKTSSKSSSTSESTPKILDWLLNCNCTHSCCKQNQQPRFLPGRLIDVGTPTTTAVRLVCRANIPTHSKYLTLSHCWGSKGGNSNCSLTEARLLQYQQEIPLATLPKTFTEAIHMTRALGERYMWIDSLCIIQDSPQDWRQESAAMWEVYTNSYLNLSATASENSNEGLFRNRLSKTCVPCIVTVGQSHPKIDAGEYICYVEDEWLRDVDHGPVNTRAWVLQERVLAPRIVHFARDQVFWECHELKASETFPQGIPSTYRSLNRKHILMPDQSLSDKYKLLDVWQSIVRTYSWSNLTYPSDKLVAISALARQVSIDSPLAGEYLAGMWKGLLLEQLLWKSTPHSKRSEQYRAPSWSWASMDGRVVPNFDCYGYGPYEEKSRSRPMIKILDATVTSMNGDSFGSASTGSLELAGPLLKITLVKEEQSDEEDEAENDPGTISKRQESLAKLMASIIPGYRGENLRTYETSEAPTDAQTISIDTTDGIMAFHEGPPKLRPISGRRIPKISFGTHEADIIMDNDGDLTAEPLFLLPVHCITCNARSYNRESYDIYSMGGLVITPTGDTSGSYRRVGMCEFGNNNATEFLCRLGNQDQAEITCGELSEEMLMLDDFAPTTWPCKELYFMPQEFYCWRITIV